MYARDIKQFSEFIESIRSTKNPAWYSFVVTRSGSDCTFIARTAPTFCFQDSAKGGIIVEKGDIQSVRSFIWRHRLLNRLALSVYAHNGRVVIWFEPKHGFGRGPELSEKSIDTITNTYIDYTSELVAS